MGYLTGLAYVILFKASWNEVCQFWQLLRGNIVPGERKIYLHLFESTIYFVQHWEYAYARWNVIGNILLFVPFGLLIGLACKGKGGAVFVFLSGFAVSLCFEAVQFLYAIGEFDVDDIMLNVIGALSGYGGMRVSQLYRRGKRRRG